MDWKVARLNVLTWIIPDSSDCEVNLPINLSIEKDVSLFPFEVSIE